MHYIIFYVVYIYSEDIFIAYNVSDLKIEILRKLILKLTSYDTIMHLEKHIEFLVSFSTISSIICSVYLIIMLVVVKKYLKYNE